MKSSITAGMPAPRFRFNTAWDSGLDFHRAIRGRKAVLFFLRYVGCPICQYKIAEIRRDMGRFKAQGVQCFVVLQSEPALVREYMGSGEMPFQIICDPRQDLFRLYGVEPGNLFQYITPSVIKKAFKAKRQGFSHGKKEGNEMQRPAVFLIDEAGMVSFAYYGKDIGDVPENGLLLARLGGE